MLTSRKTSMIQTSGCNGSDAGNRDRLRTEVGLPSRQLNKLILAASRAFIALEQDARKTFDASGDPVASQTDIDAQRARAYDAQVAHIDCLCALPAETWEDLHAKASSLVAWSPEVIVAQSADRTSALLASLLSDILAFRK